MSDTLLLQGRVFETVVPYDCQASSRHTVRPPLPKVGGGRSEARCIVLDTVRAAFLVACTVLSWARVPPRAIKTRPSRGRLPRNPLIEFRVRCRLNLAIELTGVGAPHRSLHILGSVLTFKRCPSACLRGLAITHPCTRLRCGAARSGSFLLPYPEKAGARRARLGHRGHLSCLPGRMVAPSGIVE